MQKFTMEVAMEDDIVKRYGSKAKVEAMLYDIMERYGNEEYFDPEIEADEENIQKVEDFVLESNEAGVTLMKNLDWCIWFFDTPIDGKALSIDFTPENYPILTVECCGMTKAYDDIAQAIRNGYEDSTSF